MNINPSAAASVAGTARAAARGGDADNQSLRIGDRDLTGRYIDAINTLRVHAAYVQIAIRPERNTLGSVQWTAGDQRFDAIVGVCCAAQAARTAGHRTRQRN